MSIVIYYYYYAQFVTDTLNLPDTYNYTDFLFKYNYSPIK